ncbi:TKL protein kinase [Saprolegnia diclina VS20]|uniref:TKL protein kinase n=1 Tax=Saprolegnia diclina (strain VS20) TaxID=1156394 RepID=T0Q2K5_SAPDV|nr:TKL protein kinase [Saprolegnia diclina VS20]EQC27635.1 TKL protein kinase [Saprolegnia diclina VS20]|eukprot:XP_008618903.1 TKL protein kinase [Saprolegnia diclina VS20]
MRRSLCLFALCVPVSVTAQSLEAECARYGRNTSSSDWLVYTNDAYCATPAFGCLLNTASCSSANATKAMWGLWSTLALKLPLCNAVGNIASLNASSIWLRDQPSVDMKDAILPSTLNELYIMNTSVHALFDSPRQKSILPEALTTFMAGNAQLGETAATFIWPSGLDRLSLKNVSVNAMPRIVAPVLRELHLENFTSSSKMLDLIPTRSPSLMTLRDDSMTSIVDRNWSGTISLELSDNPNLRTITNLTLSPGLRYLNCSLTSITLYQTSFEAFDRLGYSVPVGDFGLRNPAGVAIDANVPADATACTARNGTVQTLQKLLTSRFNVQICVLPNPPIATPTSVASTSSSNTGLIVGCTVGGVVVLSLLTALLFRRRAKRANTDTTYYDLATYNGTQGTGDYSEMGLNVDDLRMHKLDVGDYVVTAKKPLASGAFGEVWLGAYGNDKVAIKRIKDRRVESVRKFIDEITLMAKMDSDFIVAFVGVGWRRPIEIEVIVEYMDLGDLCNYLRTTSSAQFDWRQKTSTIMSIVRGLVYLHTFEPAIIHRDLKSRNVLLDAKKGTKLTDFGASREASDANMTNGIGTYQWMAPEVIMGTDYTIAADIYSFGVILSELSTHAVPYGDVINPATGRAYTQQAIMAKVTSGELRPTFESVTTPTWVREMGHQCLAASPEDRPTALLLTSMVQRAMSQSV